MTRPPPMTEDDRAALVQQAVFYRDLAAQWQATAEAYRADATVAKDRVAELERKLNLAVAASSHKAELLNAANARADAAERQASEQATRAVEYENHWHNACSVGRKLESEAAALRAAERDLEHEKHKVAALGGVATRAEAEAEALRARIAELEAINRGLGLEATEARARAEAAERDVTFWNQSAKNLGDERIVAEARTEAAERGWKAAKRETAQWRSASERAESEAADRRAEVNRHKRGRADNGEAYDDCSARLAAAAALLDDAACYLEDSTHQSWWAAYRAFLSTTPAPSERAAAERAVLEAMSALSDEWLQSDWCTWRRVADAELARRAVTGK